MEKEEIREAIKEVANEMLREKSAGLTAPGLAPMQSISDEIMNIQIQKVDDGYILSVNKLCGYEKPIIATSFENLVEKLKPLIG